MSVNKYTTTDGLQTLANGSRVWIGTKANHAAARQAGTLPTDCLICITDDDDEYKTDQVIEDSQMAITSGGVYDALDWKLLDSKTGMTKIDLPSSYKELHTRLEYSNWQFTFHNINGETGYFYNGLACTTSNIGAAGITINNGQIWNTLFYFNGSDVTTSATITVYYR